MTIGCNIWMICSKLNRFFYGLSRMLPLSEIVWILRSSVLVVFNNFLLIDATDRSRIRSDQKRFFIALSLYPFSFFANTPFKTDKIRSSSSWNIKSMVDSKSHSSYKKMTILGYFKTDKIRSSSSWNIKSTVDSKSHSKYKKMLILGYFKTDKILHLQAEI